MSRAFGQGIAISNNQCQVGDKLLEQLSKNNDEEDGSESDDADALDGEDPEEET